MLPLTPFVQMQTFGDTKYPHPAGQEGAPHLLRILGSRTGENGIFRKDIHNMQGNDVAQKGQIRPQAFIKRGNRRGSRDWNTRCFLKCFARVALRDNFVHMSNQGLRVTFRVNQDAFNLRGRGVPPINLHGSDFSALPAPRSVAALHAEKSCGGAKTSETGRAGACSSSTQRKPPGRMRSRNRVSRVFGAQANNEAEYVCWGKSATLRI